MPVDRCPATALSLLLCLAAGCAPVPVETADGPVLEASLASLEDAAPSADARQARDAGAPPRDAARDSAPADAPAASNDCVATELAAPCAEATPQGGACQRLTVRCPELEDREVQLRRYAATGSPRGTVVLGSGGDGTLFYAGSSTELGLVQRLTAAGFTVLDRAWVGAGGWFPGSGGLSSVARRFTAVLRYARSQLAAGGALCATGNSGGSVELGYALTRAGASALLDLAVPSSGPFHRLELACGATDPAWPDACRSLLATSCPTCDASRCGGGAPPEIRSLLNLAYGGAAPCTGDPNTVDSARLAPDSITAASDLRLLRTRVRILLGRRDPSGLPAFGLATDAALRAAGASSEVRVVDAGHNLPGAAAGVDELVSVLSADCVAR